MIHFTDPAKNKSKKPSQASQDIKHTSPCILETRRFIREAMSLANVSEGNPLVIVSRPRSKPATIPEVSDRNGSVVSTESRAALWKRRWSRKRSPVLWAPSLNIPGRFFVFDLLTVLYSHCHRFSARSQIKVTPYRSKESDQAQ